MTDNTAHAVASTNPCHVCAPLGAALAFHGVEGAVCLLHGSQGCSTYIRRYLISHFKEPLDIASTNFSEESAIFGGRENYLSALDNLAQQYQPQLIGVATTCLAETMGEDLGLYRNATPFQNPGDPTVVTVSTAAYKGTHADGFHETVRALVSQLTQPRSAPSEATLPLVVFAPMVSPADLRALKDSVTAFGLSGVLVPDWSQTLDGGPWKVYTPLPSGGTSLASLRSLAHCCGWVELGDALALAPSTAGTELERLSQQGGRRLPLPLGVKATDQWFEALSGLSAKAVPEKFLEQRGRLLDALVDGHKVIAGARVAVYGEDDLVCALVRFLNEVGAHVVAVASGERTGRLRSAIESLSLDVDKKPRILSDSDFFDLEADLEEQKIDLLVGGSKGYKLSQSLQIPLVRVGFPIHDRVGGPRIRLLGYDGALELWDRMVNALIEDRQRRNPAGYTYY